MHHNAPHVVVTLSHHGFGHGAMTAPIVEALLRARPGLRLTLRTALPHWFLEQTFPKPFRHEAVVCDPGMEMTDAFTVQIDESADAYAGFHRDWQSRIDAEAAHLKSIGADLVLSNVAYLPLIAAKQAGIPAVGYCCLNWGDIYHHYCNGHAEATAIHRQIVDAYAAADLFLRPAPSMPMGDLVTQAIGPVAALGENRRPEIAARLDLAADTRFILASMGGVSTAMDLSRLPRIDGIHYLVPNEYSDIRSDMSHLADTGCAFVDTLCSSAVYLTKPGYGSFSQAACNGIPLLYAGRNWPEQPYLTQWLQQHLPCHEISEPQLRSGNFEEALRGLLACTAVQKQAPTGIDDAVDRILSHLT